MHEQTWKGSVTIAVLGCGRVGTALGKRWAATGHSVLFGTHKIVSVDGLEASGIKRDVVMPISQAASMAEVVLLSVPYPAVEEVVQAAGGLHGKIVLDCTDPYSRSEGPFHGFRSGAEHIQRIASGSSVVKIFNSVGYNTMANANYDGGPPTMLYAGDNEGAKRVAHELASSIGFEAVDVGPLDKSSLLESLANLWVALAEEQHMGYDIAFRLLRR